MLFALDQKFAPALWMKGMRFPLDILFFDKEGEVIKIMKNLQPCTDCPIYVGPPHAAYALEICAGLAEKIGVSLGDRFFLIE